MPHLPRSCEPAFAGLLDETSALVAESRHYIDLVSDRAVAIQEGALRIEQRIRTSRRQIGIDVSGPVCIYAHVQVTSGRVLYLHGNEEVIAPSCFSLYLPPKGVGALYIRRGVVLEPLIHGGGHEGGRRAGNERPDGGAATEGQCHPAEDGQAG